jgi:hypothetical protein
MDGTGTAGVHKRVHKILSFDSVLNYFTLCLELSTSIFYSFFPPDQFVLISHLLNTDVSRLCHSYLFNRPNGIR